ncbi:MAG: 2-C-methyl-D-erythritol 4-phosphate cytidylyltransferase, partial [Actinomycetes bacterium]
LELGGITVVERSVAAARSVCAGVVVVVGADVIGTSAAVIPGADEVVAGGPTRSASVRLGIAALPAAARVVLVHDAARPLAPVEVFRRVVASIRSGAAAVVPVVPLVDTIRTVEGELIDRDRLVAVQTPQGFLRSALEAAHATDADATDDAGLMELIGAEVVTVPGDPVNIKITTPSDLLVAAALLATGDAATTEADAGDSSP